MWHATVPHAGRTSDLVSWWAAFKDTSLSSLIRHAEDENPDLASAAADIDSARASLASARAGFFPVLDGSAYAVRSGNEGDAANYVPAATVSTGTLDASWEIDLFGKTRQLAKAARFRIHEEAANWHDVRVSLAAEVADYYVQYRACRQIESSYRIELASQRETISAEETAAQSGLISTADLALARASAASSSSTLIAQRAECEVIIKSLAQLTGGDEIRVRQLLARGKSGIPVPPSLTISEVPADALRQRPDINALELEVAASIADVGAAKADLYPTLSLTGSVSGIKSTATGLSIPWSFGPALSIPFLDGGVRRAVVKSEIADYDRAVATYKSGVLSAVAEIETNLVRLDSTRRRIHDAQIAARNYREYFNSVDASWKAGGTSLIDREEARRSAQAAEIDLIEVRRDAVRYWIALYKALGGGWDLTAPPPTLILSKK